MEREPSVSEDMIRPRHVNTSRTLLQCPLKHELEYETSSTFDDIAVVTPVLMRSF